MSSPYSATWASWRLTFYRAKRTFLIRPMFGLLLRAELEGSDHRVRELGESTLVPSDGEHRHWCTMPVSLIIEADNSWPSRST
jgi:hypothetical protein